MDKQAREARRMAKELPLKAKISYIWTYYKWWIISISAAVLLIGGTAYEMATRPTYDLEIGFYSEKYMDEESIAALEEYFSQFVEDTDGDGKQTVRIYNTSISMMGGSGEGEMAIQSKFMAELSSGAYPVFMFDDYFYQIMQGESYHDTMESFRNIGALNLPENIHIPENNHIYWATRALYANESKKESKVSLHDKTVELEYRIFGERTE